MALKVTVGKPEPTNYEPDGARVYMVTAAVEDDEHPTIAGTFGYLTAWVSSTPGDDLFLQSVRVGPPPGHPVGKIAQLTVSLVRDLPLARWEAAARAHVAFRIRRPSVRPGTVGHLSRDLRAAMLVKRLYPSLADSETKADQRRYRSLVHLATIAEAFQVKQIEGTPDPAAAVARDMDVNPATVRSWLHRARKAGLLTGVASIIRIEEGES
jgi:hypothetical protein